MITQAELLVSPYHFIGKVTTFNHFEQIMLKFVFIGDGDAVVSEGVMFLCESEGKPVDGFRVVSVMCLPSAVEVLLCVLD